MTILAAVYALMVHSTSGDTKAYTGLSMTNTPAALTIPSFTQSLVDGSDESVDICFQVTLYDEGNYRFNYRHPGTWWHAPEWWAWVNSTCLYPGYSGQFLVTCKLVRHAGLPSQGRMKKQLAECPNGLVCLNKYAGESLFRAEGPQDILCIPSNDVQVQRVLLDDRNEAHWCSRLLLLQTQSNAQPRGSHAQTFQLTMEAHSTVPGAFDVAHLWFEVTSVWWKKSHRFGDVQGRWTAGIVNTAPALGRTYVSFCADFKPDTIHKVMPWVAILYSFTLVKQHRRHPGNSKEHILDVEVEPHWPSH